jgi:hypothetical protein
MPVADECRVGTTAYCCGDTGRASCTCKKTYGLSGYWECPLPM